MSKRFGKKRLKKRLGEGAETFEIWRNDARIYGMLWNRHKWGISFHQLCKLLQLAYFVPLPFRAEIRSYLNEKERHIFDRISVKVQPIDADFCEVQPIPDENAP